MICPSHLSDVATHTHTFNGPLSGTTRVGRYQKGETNLDFTEARDSEWQWHQLGHMLVCTSLQADNHASTPPLSLSWEIRKKSFFHIIIIHTYFGLFTLPQKKTNSSCCTAPSSVVQCFLLSA